jgi:hypothetical protein
MYAEARQARAGAFRRAALSPTFVLRSRVILLSLTDFDIYAIADGQPRVVGVATPQLTRTTVLVALANTTVFVAVATPLSIAISLAAALLVTAAAVRLAGLFRTLFFVPVVTSLVAVAVVWRYLYHPRFGLLNYGLGLLGVAPHDWLGDPRLALPAIIVLAVWKNFGFNMVVFMAGLQSIRPRSTKRRASTAPALGAVPAHHPADAAPDDGVRDADDVDRQLPALRRALHHDPRRPVEQHAQRRALHVRPGLPVVESRLRGGAGVRAVLDHPRRLVDRAAARSDAMSRAWTIALHVVLAVGAVLTALPLVDGRGLVHAHRRSEQPAAAPVAERAGRSPSTRPVRAARSGARGRQQRVDRDADGVPPCCSIRWRATRREARVPRPRPPVPPARRGVGDPGRSPCCRSSSSPALD